MPGKIFETMASARSAPPSGRKRRKATHDRTETEIISSCTFDIWKPSCTGTESHTAGATAIARRRARGSRAAAAAPIAEQQDQSGDPEPEHPLMHEVGPGQRAEGEREHEEGRRIVVGVDIEAAELAVEIELRGEDVGGAFGGEARRLGVGGEAAVRDIPGVVGKERMLLLAGSSMNADMRAVCPSASSATSSQATHHQRWLRRSAVEIRRQAAHESEAAGSADRQREGRGEPRSGTEPAQADEQCQRRCAARDERYREAFDSRVHRRDYRGVRRDSAILELSGARGLAGQTPPRRAVRRPVLSTQADRPVKGRKRSVRQANRVLT